MVSRSVGSSTPPLLFNRSVLALSCAVGLCLHSVGLCFRTAVARRTDSRSAYGDDILNRSTHGADILMHSTEDVAPLIDVLGKGPLDMLSTTWLPGTPYSAPPHFGAKFFLFFDAEKVEKVYACSPWMDALQDHECFLRAFSFMKNTYSIKCPLLKFGLNETSTPNDADEKKPIRHSHPQEWYAEFYKHRHYEPKARLAEPGEALPWENCKSFLSTETERERRQNEVIVRAQLEALVAVGLDFASTSHKVLKTEAFRWLQKQHKLANIIKGENRMIVGFTLFDETAQEGAAEQSESANDAPDENVKVKDVSWRPLAEKLEKIADEGHAEHVKQVAF
eukprot:TRINITY_DN19890_c0_g1_i1.p1 TRINITY_DN19890_c0_g1~~TRINITY_DN19890_c0_g1_i1.p1  ORF type:complete len:353 (-),score=45.76 TRINITY_DN19890_c0_g1_i1:52-1059(-)